MTNKEVVILAHAIGTETERKLGDLIEAKYPPPFQPAELNAVERSFLHQQIRRNQRKLEKLGSEWIKNNAGLYLPKSE